MSTGKAAKLTVKLQSVGIGALVKEKIKNTDHVPEMAWWPGATFYVPHGPVTMVYFPSVLLSFSTN